MSLVQRVKTLRRIRGLNNKYLTDLVDLLIASDWLFLRKRGNITNQLSSLIWILEICKIKRIYLSKMVYKTILTASTHNVTLLRWLDPVWIVQNFFYYILSSPLGYSDSQRNLQTHIIHTVINTSLFLTSRAIAK